MSDPNQSQFAIFHDLHSHRCLLRRWQVPDKNSSRSSFASLCIHWCVEDSSVLLLVHIKAHVDISGMLVFLLVCCEAFQMLRPCLSHQDVIRLILSSLISMLDIFIDGDLRSKSDLSHKRF